MRILVCGARGFVGRAVAERLAQAGHHVLKGVRVPKAEDEVGMDFTRDLTVADWLPRLTGVDAVVNAVGILVEHGGQRFDAVHRAAPSALFAACEQTGVRRVVQISALGAEHGDTGYFSSKLAAEDYLRHTRLEWQIVRPALVYGSRGGSATFFRMLASLPLVGLPGGGRQVLQPVHIDDLCDAVAELLDPAASPHRTIELVGPDAVSYREMLARYRAAMGFAPATAVPVPAWMMRWAAAVSGLWPGAMLTPETWSMLQRGNHADVAPTTALLGRPPRSLTRFIEPDEAPALRDRALAAWRAPLLRGTLACVWAASGLLSLFVYPLADSLALLSRVGITGVWGGIALGASAALDILFAVLTLAWPGRRLWQAQIAVVSTYTAIVAVALPEFLIHPFGPILKNLAVVAILFVLLAEDSSRVSRPNAPSSAGLCGSGS